MANFSQFFIYLYFRTNVTCYVLHVTCPTVDKTAKICYICLLFRLTQPCLNSLSMTLKTASRSLRTLDNLHHFVIPVKTGIHEAVQHGLHPLLIPSTALRAGLREGRGEFRNWIPAFPLRYGFVGQDARMTEVNKEQTSCARAFRGWTIFALTGQGDSDER